MEGVGEIGTEEAIAAQVYGGFAVVVAWRAALQAAAPADRKPRGDVAECAA
ncbi:hypothetical protein D3C83_57960 [compost metagenome]